VTPDLALTAFGLFVAAIYLPFAGRPNSLLRGVLKTVPVSAFAIAAILADAPAFLGAALLFSAAGDLALSRNGRAAFLYGLAAFALAHVVYVLLFQSIANAALWEALAAHPPAAITLIILALSTEIWLAPHAGKLAWPVRIYIVLISAMGLAALTLPAALWNVTLGAALFIVSDLILAVRLFRMNKDSALALPASRLLWIVYIAGQALILFGILTV
jgi:uncharacterized membrane protein YhhN